MESASNRSALCQVSLPDFFNNLQGAPGQVAARYKSQPGIIFSGQVAG